MTGDLLLRISGQGAVYIRTNNLDEQSSDEEDESMFLRSPFETPTFNDDIPPILLEQVDLTGCDNTGRSTVNLMSVVVYNQLQKMWTDKVEAGHYKSLASSKFKKLTLNVMFLFLTGVTKIDLLF